MSEKVTISAIMAVYNGEKYLAKSVESILNQTFTDFEFLIINDASNDNSLSIIQKYAKRDSRIKIINNTKNTGLTKSLNRGIRLAKGKYIARQDCDDISTGGRFAEQIKFLQNNHNIALCGTNWDYVDSGDKIIIKEKKLFYTKYEEIKKQLPQKNCFFHSSIMFRNHNIYYREKFYFSQDYDLYLNLLSSGQKIMNIDMPLVMWRINENAVSFMYGNRQKMFAQKAKQMYQLRIAGKDDSYGNFNPQFIDDAEMSPKIIMKNVTETKLRILLENSKFNEAGNFFNEQYKNIKEASWFKKKVFSIFINFPISYKLYRRIIYKDKIH